MNKKTKSNYLCSNTQSAFIVSIKCSNINCLLVAFLLVVASGSDGIELLPQACQASLSNSIGMSLPHQRILIKFYITGNSN